MLEEKIVERIKKEIMPEYPSKESVILPALWEVQKTKGWISDEAVYELAEVLEVAPGRIFDSLTFYTMFQRKPVGRYHIQVCTNVSCDLLGARAVVEEFKKHLGIEVGETTRDGAFTLSTVECLGACGEAPVVQINEKYWTGVSPGHVKDIINKLREKK